MTSIVPYILYQQYQALRLILSAHMYVGVNITYRAIHQKNKSWQGFLLRPTAWGLSETNLFKVEQTMTNDDVGLSAGEIQSKRMRKIKSNRSNERMASVRREESQC